METLLKIIYINFRTNYIYLNIFYFETYIYTYYNIYIKSFTSIDILHIRNSIFILKATSCKSLYWVWHHPNGVNTRFVLWHVARIYFHSEKIQIKGEEMEKTFARGVYESSFETLRKTKLAAQTEKRRKEVDNSKHMTAESCVICLEWQTRKTSSCRESSTTLNADFVSESSADIFTHTAIRTRRPAETHGSGVQFHWASRDFPENYAAKNVPSPSAKLAGTHTPIPSANELEPPPEQTTRCKARFSCHQTAFPQWWHLNDDIISIWKLWPIR